MVETDIRNKDTLLEKDENDDGTPIQEVVKDGEVVAEIRNKDTLLEKDENDDGTPVKEVVSK